MELCQEEMILEVDFADRRRERREREVEAGKEMGKEGKQERRRKGGKLQVNADPGRERLTRTRD